MPAKNQHISTFNLTPGRVIGGKYEVISCLGQGWEGEVYKIREINTDIERAAKLFFPHRNLKNKASKYYARKLHRLRHCNMVIQYSVEEKLSFKKQQVSALVSEFVDGELLTDFIKTFPGKRLQAFQALHLLYALAKGLEEIHQLKEYHGDLHSGNVIVQRFGLHFDLKILDMFHWGAPSRENIPEDTINMVHIFYETLGGQKHYANQPAFVKDICCGLKRSLIKQKFRTASELRLYLEALHL